MAIAMRTPERASVAVPLARNAQGSLPASCPNCGAPIRWRACEYCRSAVVPA